MSEITCQIVETSYEGRCNNCQTSIRRQVAQIQLRTITFRLCLDCAEYLETLLEPAIDALSHKVHQK